MRIRKKTLCSASAQRGFTLVELVVTVSMATILLTIAAPSMVNLVRDARLSTDADGLVVALNMARSEAIKQKRDFKICPSATPNSAANDAKACSDKVADWNKGWILQAVSTNAIAQRAVAKSGTSMTVQNTGAKPATDLKELTFSSTLGSASAKAEFALCVSGRMQQVVEVSMSGHVSKRIGAQKCQ